ncbi:MAG: hypothetical protein M3203_02395 [Actinomycetota bacterium]|nr:hypothetical protein [Actinomycetota bacterium]
MAGEVDLLGRPELHELARDREGGCASIYLPTHRAGRETDQDRIRLKNLLAQAEALLPASKPRTQSMLAPAQRMLDDPLFWRYQADGLAVFAAPGFFRAFRLPLRFPEVLRIGDAFHLVPVLPLLTGDGAFFILALSQNSVRLFEATRYAIAELDVPGMPASMAEALSHEDPQKQLQVRSGGPLGAGAPAALFHGHGGGDEDKKQALERYFRAVDRSLTAALPDQRRPLVVAAVDYYRPIYRAVTGYPLVLADGVTGSPDGWTVKDLHEKAWTIVEPFFAAALARARTSYLSREGTGRTANTVDDIVDAARHGRVESLLVAASHVADGGAGAQHGDVDRLNQAAVQTLLTGGDVFVVGPEAMPDAAAAVLRY